MSKLSIISATRSGIRDAYCYADKKCSMWLSTAPEYLLNVSIAKRISAQLAKSEIALEWSVKETLMTDHSKRRGPLPNDLRKSGRFDIVVFHANQVPRAIIEVKHRVSSWNNLAADADRIVQTMRGKGSKVSLGILAIYLESGVDKGITANLVAWKKKSAEIQEAAKTHFGKKKNVGSHTTQKAYSTCFRPLHDGVSGSLLLVYRTRKPRSNSQTGGGDESVFLGVCE